MSGYDAGSLFVRIVPTADGFGQAAAREIRAQAPAVQAAAQQAVSGRVPYQGAYSAAVKEDAQRNVAVLKASIEATHQLQLAQVKQSVAADLARDSSAGLGRIVGLYGIAAYAGYQAAQELSKALRVEGYEAQTVEGRFRNLGAELLQGNIIGGLQAVLVHTDSVTERLQNLKEEARTTPVDLRNFGEESARTATKLEALDTAANQAKAATGDGLAKAIHQAAQESREAADDALALASAYETAASAANDVGEAVARAGSEAGAFGERVRGPGAVSAEAGRPRGAPSSVDNSNTADNRNAIAESIAARTKTLQDNLAQAQKEAAEAAQTERNIGKEADGALAAHRATVEAQTRVSQIEQQIDDQAAQTAKEAAAAREKAAREAESARAEAQRAYEQQVSNDLKRLEIAADAAGNVGKAEQNYLKALQREAHDARLSTQAQLGYQAELTNERQNQTQALAAAAQAETDRRLALDDLRIQQADLTDNTDDNERAINRKISDLKKLRAATKKYSQEWIDFTAQITGLQLQKKNLGSSAGSGFTIEELFGEAQKNFNEFSSNVSSSPMSAGGVRGEFSAGILQYRDRIDQAKLAGVATTNDLLGRILGAINGGRGPSRIDPDDPIGPAGFATAAHARKFTGLTG